MSARSDAHAYWDTIGATEDGLPGGWRRQAREEHLDLVARWIGTPTGRWLKTDLFEERDGDRALLPRLVGADWIGTDLSYVVARRSRSASPRSAAADVRRLPFVAGAFAGILSTSTLDHFDDVAEIERSLIELHRVLDPDGQLVLTLDNPRNPLVWLRNALPPAVARRTGLVPFAVGATLGEGAARELLESVGFVVVASEHLLHVPHVVGTRMAAWSWFERHVLGRFAVLAGTRVAPWTGHYVALLARPAPSPRHTSLARSTDSRVKTASAARNSAPHAARVRSGSVMSSIRPW